MAGPVATFVEAADGVLRSVARDFDLPRDRVLLEFISSHRRDPLMRGRTPSGVIYSVHGIGCRFRMRHRGVVDLDLSQVGSPMFDAWRIRHWAESVGIPSRMKGPSRRRQERSSAMARCGSWSRVGGPRRSGDVPRHWATALGFARDVSGALRIQVRETVLIIDGGPNAELPAGSGGPVLAGPEAIFVMGRIAADAPTLFRMGAPGGAGHLTLAHSGALATPDRRIRVVTVEGEVLGEVGVSDASTPLSIFLSDDVEPDGIYVSLLEASPFK